MRLIDADALLATYDREHVGPPGRARKLIEEAPDALVRCRDCKYWSAERITVYNKCRRWINVGVKNFATMGSWFCADGERKN